MKRMRTGARVFPLVGLVVAAACQGAPEGGAEGGVEGGGIAFTDVTVVPMDEERVLTGHTVLVQGDRIVAVGPTGSVDDLHF